ncbi:hypothetical protein I2W78_00740 [Streptomyces spinoverrucosus]|uniref:hypothetical protein n=1 Tax=Streptomyces spinoverrucosus TaxID=284043 RepID=UPI0018C417F0|nr:hypothetical protein [Streptomyces spinoverrucosus]MBG0850426.1 hypothetical protein [Streptomyces spinoverrucosus]
MRTSRSRGVLGVAVVAAALVMGAATPALVDNWSTSQPVSATPQGNNYGTVAPLDDWITVSPQGDSYGTVVPLGSVWGAA